jgi:hypothetical protein
LVSASCCAYYQEPSLVTTLKGVYSSNNLDNTVEFRKFNIFCLAMALGSTQHIAEMSTRNLPRAECRRRIRLTSPLSVTGLSRGCGILGVSKPYAPPLPVTRTAFSFSFYLTNSNRTAVANKFLHFAIIISQLPCSAFHFEQWFSRDCLSTEVQLNPSSTVSQDVMNY